MWANAEDFEDELFALASTKLANKEHLKHCSGKYGPRGPYSPKEFFDLYLELQVSVNVDVCLELCQYLVSLL